MKLPYFALASAFLLVSLGASQDVPGYLLARKKLGISQPTGVAALETLVGTRKLEVRGIVKGTSRGADFGVILLESSGGEPLHIEAPAVPEFLVYDSGYARLLIEASRSSNGGSLKARLLAAAPDTAIVPHDPKPARAGGSGTSRAATIPRTAPRPVGSKKWNLPASDALPYYAAFIKQRNKRLSDSEAMRIAEGVIGFSLRYGTDARLIMAMVLCESGFNPSAKSHAGAMGLGQLMPSTAAGMGVSNAYDSIENLNATVRLVRGHLDKYGKKTNDPYQALVLSLAAYNAGSGAVRRHGGVPPYKETQGYIRKVVRTYQELCGD